MKTTESRYPQLEVDLGKFRHNIDKVVGMCNDMGIEVAGVIKGFHGIPGMVSEFAKSNCKYIASSRMEQLLAAKDLSLGKPLFLIRVPMLSEVPELVANVEYSLESSVEVLKKIMRNAKSREDATA